jgi:hypothetical protein
LSLLSEVLVISGVAMDLVGAAVLSHAHKTRSLWWTYARRLER